MVMAGELEAEWSHPGWASSPAWHLNPFPPCRPQFGPVATCDSPALCSDPLRLLPGQHHCCQGCGPGWLPQ